MNVDEFRDAVERIEGEAGAVVAAATVVAVEPGDVVWLKVDRHIDQETAQRITEVARSVFTENRVILTPPGLDISLFRSDMDEAPTERAEHESDTPDSGSRVAGGAG